jgi:predicted MPP superfamily phosphohydrolase
VAAGDIPDARAVPGMNIWRRCLQHLEIGARKPLLVRHEGLSHLGLDKRILFASDLHLRRDGPSQIIDGILDIVSREHPDIVLLGGDLVDWMTGLETLRDLVDRMTRTAPVAAVGGNHDRWIGLARVRDAVLRGGGHWLEDKPLEWSPGVVAYGSPEDELIPAACQILCSHDPRSPSARRRYDLVLSGHLHGGQFVFYERGGRFYPGALLYRWNGLRFQDNGSTLLVSRGVRDTLPLRWNCPREVIVVDL